jgi:hypothetical protein
MNLSKFFKGRFSTAVNSVHAHRRYVLIVVLLLSLTIVNTVYAGATWSNWTSFVWRYPPDDGYQISVDATLTDPHYFVSLNYTVTRTDPPLYFSECVDCTGVSGTYTCIIPTTYTNSYISWSVKAYDTTKCGFSGHPPVDGRSGWFTTGPTAVTLSSFKAENVTESSFSTGSILAIAGGVLLLLLALWQGRKLLKGKSA